jgi:hypothetical protein
MYSDQLNNLLLQLATWGTFNNLVLASPKVHQTSPPRSVMLLGILGGKQLSRNADVDVLAKCLQSCVSERQNMKLATEPNAISLAWKLTQE